MSLESWEVLPMLTWWCIKGLAHLFEAFRASEASSLVVSDCKLDGTRYGRTRRVDAN